MRAEDSLPDRLLDLEAGELHKLLGGPTLFHLAGRRAPPLFVSVLLHGDEDSGWLAMRALLRRHDGKELPRALSLFIANTAAAEAGRRYLPGQRDYNRIWTGTGDGAPELVMARRIIEEMRRRGVFASVDIHNNTGFNPHYACVRELDGRSLQLAALFGRTVVYARRPTGVQAEAFSGLCPAVTIECGQKGLARGAEHAREFVEACLRLEAIPEHPVADRDLDLYHTVATVRVKEGVTFAFGPGEGEVLFRPDLDHLNFREIPPGTALGVLSEPAGKVLSVLDEKGRDVTDLYLKVSGGVLVTEAAFMPSMFTVDAEAVRLDCLGYFMERIERQEGLSS